MLFFCSFCRRSCTTEVASRDTIRLTWHTSSYNKMGQKHISTCTIQIEGIQAKTFPPKRKQRAGDVLAQSCSIIISRVSRVVKSSMLLSKITAYLVSIRWLLAFPYGWHFSNKISLDWPLTLTTPLATSKLSDNPECHTASKFVIIILTHECSSVPWISEDQTFWTPGYQNKGLNEDNQVKNKLKGCVEQGPWQLGVK